MLAGVCYRCILACSLFDYRMKALFMHFTLALPAKFSSVWLRNGVRLCVVCYGVHGL